MYRDVLYRLVQDKIEEILKHVICQVYVHKKLCKMVNLRSDKLYV
jgi:hypothetical protein